MNALSRMTILEGLAWIVGLLIVWSIYRAQRSEEFHEFNLFDLVMENGRLSKIAVITIGSWLAMTYAFLGMYWQGKMTEAVLLAYGGLCFGPMVAKMFAAPAPPSTTTVSSVSETKVEVTK